MPILTAGAESAEAKANGLATMKRGAALTVEDDVRAPRGIPCAASGAASAPPATTRVTRRNRNMP